MIGLTLGSAAAATIPGGTVALAWDPVSLQNVTGYQVHIGTQSGQYLEVRDIGSALSHVVSGLTVGQTYYFAVTSVNADGMVSVLSQELRVKLAPPAPTVSQSLAVLSPDSAKLGWKYSALEAGSVTEFAVYASTDLSTWTEIGTVLPLASTGSAGGNLSFEWPMPIDAPKKFFKVAPRNPEGETF